MKIIAMKAVVDNEGRIVLPAEATGSAGLKPGDEVYVTLAAKGSGGPMFAIVPGDAGDAVTLLWQGDKEGEDELQLPHGLLEEAGIPLDSDLDVICSDREIIIRPSDPLESLPDVLRGLFENLGVSPDTVRKVMKEEGYFV
ncbi:AbrB/MazE/SpoVT family DNA-binding domain-containing protein [Desulfitobacterium hafniense]|nr:AbrB/MazE/SpoVT family DNA-binding domain-containing protein [Desulfitobacterium hafniense]